MLTRAARERAGRRFPSRLPPDLVLQFLEPRDLVLQACVSVGWRDAADLVFRQVEARETATTADATYMLRQTNINAQNRAVVIDWLIEVHHHVKEKPEILYLTVNIIDRYLSVAPPVARNKLQLLSVAALGVAADRFSIAIRNEILSYLCDRAYPPAEVCAMRATIVSVLGHDITTVSTRYFMMRYLRAGCPDEVSRDLVWHASHSPSGCSKNTRCSSTAPRWLPPAPYMSRAAASARPPGPRFSTAALEFPRTTYARAWRT